MTDDFFIQVSTIFIKKPSTSSHKKTTKPTPAMVWNAVRVSASYPMRTIIAVEAKPTTGIKPAQVICIHGGDSSFKQNN
jgi:hypothetical protein